MFVTQVTAEPEAENFGSIYRRPQSSCCQRPCPARAHDLRDGLSATPRYCAGCPGLARRRLEEFLSEAQHRDGMVSSPILWPSWKCPTSTDRVKTAAADSSRPDAAGDCRLAKPLDILGGRSIEVSGVAKVAMSR